MKKILSALFVLSAMLSAGQPGNDTLSVKGTEFDLEEIEASVSGPKPRLTMEFGTTFGASRYGSYFGTYVSPNISYPLNHRLSIGAGGYFSGISPMVQGESAVGYGNPYANYYSRSYVYIQGTYRLSQNLTVSGTAYKEINLLNSTSQYPGYYPDVQGFIMGIDYKFGNNIFIRGEIEVSNGNRFYRSDPFMSPAGRRMGDPFFYQP